MKHAKIARYNLDGFSILKQPVLDASRVSAARRGMEMLRAGEYDIGNPPEASPWNPGDDPHTLCKIELPQKTNRAIAQLISSSEIGECVAATTGASMVQVWWVQLLYKPPTPQGVTAQTTVGWHQDWTYWQSTWAESSELLTAWVALGDVTECSGPMRFVPGSHRWEGVDGGDFFSQNLDPGNVAVPAGATWSETPAVMQAGGLSLHHKLTLHGSGHNRSDNPRCSLAIHVRTENSQPLGGEGQLLTRYLDDSSICPIIYGSRVDSAFVRS